MTFKSMLFLATLLLVGDAHAGSSELADNQSASWGEYMAEHPEASNAVQEGRPAEPYVEPEPRVPRVPVTRAAPSPVEAPPLAEASESGPTRHYGRYAVLALGVFLLWRWFRG